MKYKIAFLTDKKNKETSSIILNKLQISKKKYSIFHTSDYKLIKNKDIVFVLNYTKILKKKFFILNKLVLIPHSSNLPKDKGFAPIQNQIIRNENKIYNCLVKASANYMVDSGPIYLKEYFNLTGNELWDEIINKSATEDAKLISIFLNKFPNVHSKKQIGKSTFNKKRNPEDSQININKSIKSQFNILRVCSNKNYPAYFKYKKRKFVIKIYSHDKT